MNLTKLFETQKVLRDRINYNEPDRFNKLILALLVELGECANEWRGFKFWSTDQEPRISKHVLKKEYQYLHITQTGAYEYQLRDEFGKVVFDDVTDHHHDHKNPLLEEYVDGLHFVLEVGIELNLTDFGRVTPFIDENITTQFNECFQNAVNVGTAKDYDQYVCLVAWFLGLGEMLGFTWEQIEEAYYKKNQINHDRQDNGY